MHNITTENRIRGMKLIQIKDKGKKYKKKEIKKYRHLHKKEMHAISRENAELIWKFLFRFGPAPIKEHIQSVDTRRDEWKLSVISSP